MPDAPAPSAAAPAGTTATTGDNAPAQAPVGVVIASSPGSEAAALSADTTAWLAGLDTETRELATKKGWKTDADRTKSYIELEKAFSTRAPGTEKPTYKPDDFKFTLPANAKDINYSDQFANGFRDLAIKAELSPAQAASVHDWYTGFATERHQAMGTETATKTAERVTAATAALATAWGAENNPAYKRNVELAQRAITQLGAMDMLKKSGAVVEHQGQMVVADAAALQQYAKIGAAMYAEDTLHGGDGGNGINPFDTKTENQSLQGELIRNDPEKALLLIGALSPADQARWQPVLARIRDRVSKKK